MISWPQSPGAEALPYTPTEDHSDRCPYYNLVPKEQSANLLWRKKIINRAAGDREMQQDLWVMCARDVLFYINTFCWIFEPRTRAVLPFITFPFQDDAILEICDCIGKRDLVVVKSRDMGASWMCITAMEWTWHFHSFASFLWMSRKKSLVYNPGDPKALFTKFAFLHQHQPGWLLPSTHQKELHSLNIDNNSVIDGETTAEFSGVSDRRLAVFKDEFSKMDNQATIFRGMRDVTNCRICLFTPEGSGNVAYDISRGDSSENFQQMRLWWPIHPNKNRGLYVAGRADVRVLNPESPPPDGYKFIRDGKTRSPWYDAECARARHSSDIAQELDMDFIGSASTYFEPSLIDKCVGSMVEPPRYTGALEYTVDPIQPTRFSSMAKGRLDLWCPLQQGRPTYDHRYAIGADISSGTGASNSCLVVSDITTQEQVAEYTDPHIRPEELAELAVALAMWFHDASGDPAHMIWEAPGPGRNFEARILDLGFRNFYHRRDERSLVRRRKSNIPGWWPTKDEKQRLFGDFKAALHEDSFQVRSKHQLEECRHFIYTNTRWILHTRESNSHDPSGAGEQHGDRPTAGALCYKIAKEKAAPPGEGPVTIPVGCFAWRRKIWDEEQLETTMW